MDNHSANMQLIADLSRKSSEIQQINYAPPDHEKHGLPAEIPLLILPGQNTPIDITKAIEAWRNHPSKITGTAKIASLDSLIQLINRAKRPESVVFADADWKTPSITAVIDYHGGPDEEHQPGWAKHQIRYAFPLSDQWTAWMSQHSKAMSQVDFAELIEDRIADLSSPTDTEVERLESLYHTRIATPAEMVQMSRRLEITAESSAKSALSLQSGEVEIHYDEVHRNGAGEKLVVPGLFMLQIPLFNLGLPARIPVRLRYRLASGAVTWTYLLVQPEIYIAEAVGEAFRRVRDETKLPLIHGTPEA